MRPLSRLLAAAAATGMLAFGWQPVAQAAPTTVVTVNNDSAAEGAWRCGSSAPYACSLQAGHLSIGITAARTITLTYVIEGVTATAGQDYTGPTSGMVTVPTSGYTSVIVPLVIDSSAEPPESLRLRITGASAPADISDTGVGTILDGIGVPTDCTPSKYSSTTIALDCTQRPATASWRLVLSCATGAGWGEPAYGNVVTGNGRSTATCVGLAQGISYRSA